jgi:hypothetical protein
MQWTYTMADKMTTLTQKLEINKETGRKITLKWT